MKNGLLLLLFILALSSCTIEKRRYFKGYHVENGKMRKWGSGRTGLFDSLRERDSSTASGTTRSTSSGTAPRHISPAARQEGDQETSEATKPQRGDIVIDDKTTAIDQSNAGDTTPDSDVQKPQRGDIVIAGDIVLRSPEDATTANSPLPIQNTARVMGHKTSHALEGLGAIFLIGIITLVIVVGLIIFLLSDSAIAGLIGGLLVGLLAAIGIYLLLIFLFVALLLFIIKTFGA